MTPNEFKDKFPQYKNLEGNELWDKMTEELLSLDNVLHADPNQEKEYFPTFEVEILQNNGSYKKHSFKVETNTRWLNNKGEQVIIVEPDLYPTVQKESYRFEILELKKPS